MDGDRISFGRGSEADHRLADQRASRLHATVYRDGDRVWVIDENSSNGTFVNGERVGGSGRPLRDGDRVSLGDGTELRVRITRAEAPAATPRSSPSFATSMRPDSAETSAGGSALGLLPIVMIAAAVFVVSISAAFVGYLIFAGGSGGPDDTASVESSDIDEDRPRREPARRDRIGQSAADANDMSTPDPVGTQAKDEPIIAQQTRPASDPASSILKGRTYQQLSASEKDQYLAAKSLEIAAVIGNNAGGDVPPQALAKIRSFTEGFVSRIGRGGTDGCPTRRPWGDNLQSAYERARANAPFILRAFYANGLDPRIGLYLAMIESEHCKCLQSKTGPLGLFQFTYATAKLHFQPSDGVVRGATPDSPDIRCQPEPAARAAASYMKALMGRYGTGPASVPLAIGSYNSGEGGLSKNLQTALESNSGLPRDFWTLIANSDRLSKQFQAENFKYVPKFFAAAIIGENPQDFGLKLQPLSTYSQ